MKISSLASNNISFSSGYGYAAVKEKKFPIGIIMNNKDKDKIVNNEYSSEINFNHKEIADFYQFALKNKDYITMRVIETPLWDCKFIKTQRDAVNNTGKWLDITDYNEA